MMSKFKKQTKTSTKISVPRILTENRVHSLWKQARKKLLRLGIGVKNLNFEDSFLGRKKREKKIRLLLRRTKKVK